LLSPATKKVLADWEVASDREQRSRSLFAQESIKVEEVERELIAAKEAVGSSVDVERFMVEGLKLHGAAVEQKDGEWHLDLRSVPTALKDALRTKDASLRVRFEPPVKAPVVYVTRTHPIVEGLADYVRDTALDPALEGKAARAGAIRTRDVAIRTTVLLVRFRFHIVHGRGADEQPLLAEECRVLAFEGAPEQARWLDARAAEAMLDLKPTQNVPPSVQSDFIRRVVDGFTHLGPSLEAAARERASELLDAHRRVRQEAGLRVAGLSVEPRLPPDVLGIYVYLPDVTAIPTSWKQDA